MNEPGEDGGGVCREFFTLFGKDMASKYLEKSGSFRHNALALKVTNLS